MVYCLSKLVRNKTPETKSTFVVKIIRAEINQLQYRADFCFSLFYLKEHQDLFRNWNFEKITLFSR